MITILALGLTRGQMTFQAAQALERADRVLLRTGRCEAAQWLCEENIPYETLDELYETEEAFESLNRKAAERVAQAGRECNLVYGVLDLRDETVEALLEMDKNPKMLAGVPVDSALGGFSCAPCMTFAASDAELIQPDSDWDVLVREVSSAQLAGDVKLKLMEKYPDDLQVLIGQGNGEIVRCQLCEVDRQPSYDHRTCLRVPRVQDLTRLQAYGFNQLNRIMRILRAPDGCPWDRKQTHATLRNSVVEEAYEVVDAIDRGDMADLYDELGDLLLQITLNAQIASEHGEFTIDDVTSAICHKMISRHTHIFGSDTARDAEEVLDLWEKNKQKEKHIATTATSMSTVAKAMPALMRAEKVQKKARAVGFDWDDWRGAMDKVREEAREVEAAERDGQDVELEIGDLLFAAVNLARLLHIAPELALNRATDKFIARFTAMEARIHADGRNLSDMTLAEMDAYWDRVKLDMKNMG